MELICFTLVDLKFCSISLVNCYAACLSHLPHVRFASRVISVALYHHRPITLSSESHMMLKHALPSVQRACRMRKKQTCSAPKTLPKEQTRNAAGDNATEVPT